MKQLVFLCVPVVVATLLGCGKKDHVAWTGSDINFNGVLIQVRNSEMGRTIVSPKNLEYIWNGNTLKIEDLEDGTVSVTSPKVTGLVVDKSRLIIVDAEGTITTSERADTQDE